MRKTAKVVTMLRCHVRSTLVECKALSRSTLMMMMMMMMTMMVVEVVAAV